MKASICVAWFGGNLVGLSQTSTKNFTLAMDGGDSSAWVLPNHSVIGNTSHGNYTGFPLIDSQSHGHSNSADNGGVKTSYVIATNTRDCALYEFLISVILVGVTILLGFTGNLLSFVILRRDPRRSVTLFLLTVLAVADSIFLVPMLGLSVVPGFCRYVGNCPLKLRQALPYIDQYGWAVASMGHTGTIYVTVLVTIHRYLCVCLPHDAPKLSTIPKAKRQVAMVAVLAILFSIPRFLEFDFEVIDVCKGNVTVDTQTKRTLTAVGRNTWYQVVYKNTLFYLIMYIVPLSTIIVLTSRLAHLLRRRRKNKFRMTQRLHGREDNTTFVLIVIVIIFVICQTPTPLQRLFYAIFGDEGRNCGHFFFYFERFSDYLAILNSCINFMIYVICARRFRQTLQTTLLGRKFYRRP